MQKPLWKRFSWGVFFLILSAFFFTAELWWPAADLGGLIAVGSIFLIIAIGNFVNLGWLLAQGKPSDFLPEGTYNLQWMKQKEAEVSFLVDSVPRAYFCIPTNMFFDKNEKPIKTLPMDRPFQVLHGKTKEPGEEYKEKPKLRKVYFIFPLIAQKKNK